MSYRNQVLQEIDDEIDNLKSEISDLQEKIEQLQDENERLSEMLNELIPPHKRAFAWVWETMVRFGQAL